jgi:hypothetical protein
MNVIVTAREKEDVEKKGSELIKVGYKPDTEKSTPYAFDAVIRLVATEGGRDAIIYKDRTGVTSKRIENPTFDTLFPSSPTKTGADRIIKDDAAAAVMDEESVLTDVAGPELAADARLVFAAAGINEAEIVRKKGWDDLESAPASAVRAAVAWAKSKIGDQ